MKASIGSRTIGIIDHMVMAISIYQMNMAIAHLAIATIVPTDAIPVTLINFPRGATFIKMIKKDLNF